MPRDTASPSSGYLAAGLSRKGRRESNEDSAILAVFPEPSPVRAFAVLCDGMGGHNAGEVASGLTAQLFREKVQDFAARAAEKIPNALPEVEAEVRGWIEEANREILKRGTASTTQRGMGTTLAFVLVLPEDRLLVANVGDSKVFLVSGLHVRQLSVDHTVLAEQRRALGTDALAPEDEAGSPFAHALTRSLGQEKKVNADIRTDVTLGTGDAVFLTTDGVTDSLEAERFLSTLESSGSLEETAEGIYRQAIDAGSRDNISVAIIARGKPTRLGVAATERRADSPSSAPLVASPSGILRGGAAATLPVTAPKPEPRRVRTAVLLAIGAVLLLLAGLGALIVLRRSAPRRGPAAAPPAAPAATILAPSPTPPPAAATPTSPPPAPPLAAVTPPERPALPPAPKSAPRAAGPASPREPAFRAPEVLSGLKPLEMPPTPTATPTATETPTPEPTPTSTPVPPPPPAGAPSPSSAPPKSARTT